MKKIICLCAVVCCILCVSYCFASDFSDVNKSHWAYDTINEMKTIGMVNGYEDGTFKPEKEVTREEFVQMVYKVNGSPKVEVNAQENYYDVDASRWSYNAVQYAGNSIKETSDGYVYFYPTNPIDRKDVALILSDIFKVREVEVKEISSTDVNAIKDIQELDSKYIVAITKVYNDGLMNGVSDTEFSPLKKLTRAQAATILSRIYKQNNKTPIQIPDPEPVKDPVTEKGIDLNTEFFKLEDLSKNIVYSPLSIKYALKMLSDGADGTTKAQIDKLVSSEELTKYKSSENLSLANGLYIKESFKDQVKQSYKDLLTQKYNAEVLFDKFQNANNINNWVSNKTLKLINKMFSDEDVKSCDLILMNALAIDMAWKSQFVSENTIKRDFYKDDNSKISVDTMLDVASISDSSFIPDKFAYYMDDEIQVITKDLKEYDGVNLEFMAIMPKTQKIDDFVKNLTTSKITELRGKVKELKDYTYDENRTTKVNLYLPKFKFESDLKLKEDLMSLGVVEAFSASKADFKNISDTYEFFVSDAKHKAMIEFTEDGIKAAAVTAFMMKANGFIIEKEPININIIYDHPFFFAIRDKNTQEIWFVGVIKEPKM